MPIRGQILSSNEGLPSLNKIFSLVQQDEKHRNFHKRKNSEIGSYYVQSENMKRPLRMGRTPNRPYTDFGRNGKKLNTDLCCDHCERYGHTKDICYKLVGYPPKKNQDKGKATVNAVQVTDGPTVPTANNNGFTVEQIKAIQDMISKPSVSGIFSYNYDSCYNVFDYKKNFGMINYQTEWLLDSGASAHMSGNRKLFVSLRKTNKIVKDRLPHGLLKEINRIGDVIINENFSLEDVYFVEGFAVNLIFIGQLTKTKNYQVLFNDNSCLIQERISKTLIGQGEKRSGVYAFLQDYAILNSVVTLDTWHNRMGHAPKEKLLNISFLSDLSHKTFSNISSCVFCCMAKQKKLPFSVNTTPTMHVLHNLHMDVWGPFPKQTINGQR